MFTLLALLPPAAPDVSIEALAEKVQSLFGKNLEFKLELEQLPFKKDRSLILRWQGWTARLFCESGTKVTEHVGEVARVLGRAAPAGLASASRRIRAVFYDDPQEDYIEEMVDLMRMLREMPGAIVFDPQKNDIVK